MIGSEYDAASTGGTTDMGILKTIGDFLFGKDPDIFDEQGRVRHKFSEEKWKRWDERLKANPTYDWRQHGAKERAAKPVSNSPESNQNKPI